MIPDKVRVQGFRVPLCGEVAESNLMKGKRAVEERARIAFEAIHNRVEPLDGHAAAILRNMVKDSTDLHLASVKRRLDKFLEELHK